MQVFEKFFVDSNLLNKSQLSTEIGDQNLEFYKNVLKFQFWEIFNSIDIQNQFQLAIRITDLANENLEKSLKMLELLTKKILDQQSYKEYFMVFYILQGLFLKQNWLGKDFLHKDTEQKYNIERKKKLNQEKRTQTDYDFEESKNFYGLQPQDFDLEKFNDLNKYNYRYIKQESFLRIQSKTLNDHLLCDGEMWPKQFELPQFFMAIKYMIKELNQTCQQSFPSFYLWRARFAYTYDRLLKEKTGTNQKQSFEFYQEFFKLTKSEPLPREIYAILHVEFGHVLIYYYQYNQSEQQFALAKNALNLNIQLTGVMGKRTKFQTFNVAQLSIKVKGDEIQEKKEVEEENGEEKIDDFSQEITEAEGKPLPNPLNLINENASMPQNIDFDEECILYDGPVFDEGQSKNEKDVLNQDIDVYEQIVLLGMVKHLQMSSPHDELLKEMVQAYVEILIKKSENWLVFSTTLLTRSLNEIKRLKKSERALIQIEALVNQFNDKNPNLYERFQYFYAVSYPNRLEIQETLAQQYMSQGLVMSSCQIYEKIQMLEECVECLAMGGQHGRAKELALKILERDQNPKILCIYGDLMGDVQYYKKAWKASNKKYVRAKRSQARATFFAKNFEKAIKYYRQALAVNYFQSECWFTMGCAYLKLTDFQNAIQSFSSVVQIDPQNGEGWANLSAAFVRVEKLAEALSCLEQAVSMCENSWRMWTNLMNIALKIRKFSKFFLAIETIVRLQQKDIITTQILQNINQIFDFHITLYVKNKLEYKSLEFIDKRISKVYKLLAEEIGERYDVWDNYAQTQDLRLDFLEQQQAYLISQINNEQQGSEDQKVQFKDTKSKEERIAETEKKFEKKKFEVLETRAQYMMNSCHSLMIVGWEVEVQKCKQLLIQSQKLIKCYESIKGKTDLKKLKMYIDNVKPKIESTLDHKVELSYDV